MFACAWSVINFIWILHNFFDRVFATSISSLADMASIFCSRIVLILFLKSVTGKALHTYCGSAIWSTPLFTRSYVAVRWTWCRQAPCVRVCFRLIVLAPCSIGWYCWNGFTISLSRAPLGHPQIGNTFQTLIPLSNSHHIYPEMAPWRLAASSLEPPSSTFSPPKNDNQKNIVGCWISPKSPSLGVETCGSGQRPS